VASVKEALRRAEERLRAAGIPSPGLDAELLLRHVLGIDRAGLLTRLGDPLSEDAGARYAKLLEERASRRPLQHLTGVQEFWRHAFRVTRDVMIPRPETEILVDTALRFLEGRANPVVADVGTGSGCIAVSLAHERKDARVIATDASAAALEVARGNAQEAGLGARVELRLGDLLAPIAELAGAIDLIVCNPPYVAADQLAALEPEVREQDPRLALVPPSGDALELYRRLATGAPPLLRPGGGLLVEVGYGMGEEVASLFRAGGLLVRPALHDLQGIPRVVAGERPLAG